MSWFSSIVNKVTKTVSSVVKNVVTKPISWIGDTLSDAGDWVVDEIIEPVVDGVDDVAEAIQDDPVKAIATVAAYATGNAWAIPLIEGVDVAQNGGDIGDILEASATAYVAQQAGSYAGKYASEAALSASANQTAATILGTASGQAASAAVTGQDPVEAFLQGGLQAGIDAGLGFIDEKVTEFTDDATDSIVGTGTNTGTGTTSGSVSPITETKSFLEQYPTVKNILAKSLEATLSGEDVTGELIMGEVIKGKLTKELVQEYLTTENFNPEDPSDQRYLAALTTTVQNVTNATFSGADVSDTLYASANAYGRQELNKILDKQVKNNIDKVTGDYQEVETKATELDTANAAYTQTAQEYNGYVAELQNRINVRDEKLAEVNRLREELRTSFGDKVKEDERTAYQESLDVYNAAVADFNDYAATVDTYYEDTYTVGTDALRTSLDSQEATINALVAEYDTLRDNLVSTGDQLDDALLPVTNAVQSAYVRAMTNDEFNPAEYKDVNKLGDISDDDARYHWLTTGKDEKLPVNAAQYDLELSNALEESMRGTLEVLGLKVTDLTPEQIKSLREQTLAVGNDLSSIRDIKNGSFSVANELQNKILEAEEYEDLREELIESYNVPTFNDLPEEIKKEAIKQINATEEKQKIIKPDNVSDVDILTGKATVTSNAEGLLEWGNISLRYDLPKWDSARGAVIRTVPHPTFEGADAIVDMQGRYLELNEDGQPIPSILISAGITTNDNLKEDNAGQYLDTLADVTPEAVKEAVNAGVTGLQQQYEFAKNVATYIANTETAQNIANSDFGKNTAGVVLNAGGELLDSMNNLVLIAGINPESTPLGKTAKNLIAMSGDMKTEEYKAAAAEIQETIGKANFNEDGTLKTNPDGTPLSTFAKAWNTIQAIGGAAMANPGTFASEYIAKELLQEIPILLASGGTANVVKAGLKQAGEEFAQKMGQRAALGTAGVLDVSESFGGTAGGAYDDAYATALKSGMSDAEAQEYALDKAITAGTIAAVTTVTTMGIGGNDFEKAIFNGKRGKNFSEAFDVVAKEAGQEAVEEGLPQAYLESQLYQLDPTRDVVGNVVSNSVLGALSGGSTAGSIYGGAATGDVVTNAMVMFNPEVRKVVQNEGGLDAAGVTQQLNDLGVTDDTVQANILNQVFDADYTSTGEAEQAAANYVTQNNVPYKFTQDELTQFAGSNTDADIAALVDSFVDSRYLDTQEVIAAAEAEGITLTEQQAADYVGQKDESQGVIDAIADLTSPVTKADLLQGNISQPLDSNTIKDIVDTAIADLPISASPEDVSTTINTAISNLENISSADVNTAINDALANRENLSSADVQDIIDSSISGLENISTTDVENIVDNAIANLPTSASPEDVSTAINTAISGLENISSADVSTAINNALADRENLSTTDVQGIVDSAATEFTQQVSTLETDLTALINQNAGDVDAALEQLSSNLGTTEDALLTEIGTTRDALTDQFTQQVSTLETDLTTLINQNAGDVDAALEQLSDDLGTTEDALLTEIGTTRDALTDQFTQQIKDVETTLGDQIGDVETTLGDQIGDVETSLTDVISDVNTSLTDKITTLEGAGLTRDQAIREISNQLNVSVREIQSQLAGIESGFDENILGLTSEINAIADIIGKPATQVNPTDVDFVEDVIAQVAAFSDPDPFQFTQEQLQYDVNGDGIVDINDQNLLNNAIQGQDVTFATESKFQPATGIFAQLDQQADIQAQIQADIQAQINAQTQQQIDQQAQLIQQVEDEATKTRRLDNVKDLQEMLRQDAGRITQVRSQPVAEIGPAYDFQSIFRDPAQRSFYRSPYAEGGVVDVNKELLRLIGDK